MDNRILKHADGQYAGLVLIYTNGGNMTVPVQLKGTCILAKPNPYNPESGNLMFFGDGIVPRDTRIRIFTLAGELVRTLGESFLWNGTDEEGRPVTDGIYLYTYESPKEKGIGKFTVMRRD